LQLKHLPGDQNDIAHILSHLGEQTRARQEFLEAAGVSRMAYPGLAVHSFHSTPQAKPLDGLDVVHLNLGQNQLAELQRAFLADTTEVRKVPLCEIYAVITGHRDAGKVSKLNAERIESWRDSVFFAVPAPTGVGNMLFAQASCTIDPAPDTTDEPTPDLTRHLVPVIPKGADIQVTTTEPVVADSTDTDHYMHHDLRCDICIHCHDNANHASLADTESAIRAMCWFPKMGHYVKYHWDSCSYCVAKRKGVSGVGTAVRAARRLKVIQFDFKVLDDVLKASTGRPAVLTMVDSSTGFTKFIPVPDKTSETTARTLYNNWYGEFGVPSLFQCDRDPAYVADTMAAFARIMGVQRIDFSAPDDPTQHSLVERRNQILDKHLDVGAAKGDITCADDLEVYCTMAMAACNLEQYRAGHTALEYLTGEVPRTQRDLATRLPAQTVGTQPSTEFLKQLKSLLRQSDAIMHHSRDDDARDSAMQRQERQARTRATKFDLRVGDAVSYDGERFIVTAIDSTSAGQPLKAMIRSAAHDAVAVRKVKYSDLRPLNTQRPVHMHSRRAQAIPHAVGEFVFFFDPDDPDSVIGGLVTAVDDATRSVGGDTTTVHVHRQADKTPTRFTPLYLNATNRKVEPKLSPTADHTPILLHILPSVITAQGTLSGSYRIDNHLRDHLKSSGVVDDQ